MRFVEQTLQNIRDVTRSRGARSDLSRKNVTISPKTFCSVYIRAAPLIVKNSDLDSNTHVIFFLNDNDSAVYYRVSVDREKHVLSLPMLMNQRVGHHHVSHVNAVIH